MTAQSYTGSINTNGEFVDVETLTGITFTPGNNYSVQIQNLAEWKVADAVFTILTDDVWNFLGGSDTPYIKTVLGDCTLTIYESAQE